MISEAEIGFLERRGRFIRMWRYAGATALAVLAGFTCYLFVTNPLLINPFHVMKQIEADAIPHSTMVLMAATVPIVFLILMSVMVVLVLFGFAAFSNEPRLLAIISKLRNSGGPDR